jgi:nucleotide-binding universal stress UspA family protein
MKYLIPVDGSRNFKAPLDYLVRAKRKGLAVEAILLNVQPYLDGVVSRYTRRSDRAALHAEWSNEALAPAADALSSAGIPFRSVLAVGPIAERIAKVAESEGADEIVMGAARHAGWWRWISPPVTQAVVDRTEVPVTVLARGDARDVERNVLLGGIAGVAGVAAVVLFLAGNALP